MDQISSKSWETIYRQNIARMTGICYRYTRNRHTAEDLAHQAFLIAIDKSSTFQNKGPFEAWLRRITVNVSLQWLRDQKKQHVLEKSIAYHSNYPDIPEDDVNVERPVITKAELIEAINFLPEPHRLVFNLYVIDNFTHAQIGNQLGIAEGTSKSHLARARKKIREILIQQKQKDKKTKNAFLLFIFHYNFLNIDSQVSKKLKDLAIQPQSLRPPDIVDFNNVSFDTNLTSIRHYGHVSLPVKVIAISIVAISVLYFNSSVKNKVPATYVSTRASASEIKVASTDTPTATIPDNRILFTEQTKKSVKMKSLIPSAALLLSSFAIDTPVLSSRLLPDLTDPKQTAQLSEKKNDDISRNAELMQGTIYASKLSWSDKNYAIEISGNKVSVNLNTQHFKGSGTFSFIDNVHLLIVDGVPMKLNETIRLAEKKYTFNQLTEAEATRKYGDKGKLGAVEISVAE